MLRFLLNWVRGNADAGVRWPGENIHVSHQAPTAAEQSDYRFKSHPVNSKDHELVGVEDSNLDRVERKIQVDEVWVPPSGSDSER